MSTYSKLYLVHSRRVLFNLAHFRPIGGRTNLARHRNYEAVNLVPTVLRMLSGSQQTQKTRPTEMSRWMVLLILQMSFSLRSTTLALELLADSSHVHGPEQVGADQAVQARGGVVLLGVRAPLDHEDGLKGGLEGLMNRSAIIPPPPLPPPR